MSDDQVRNRKTEAVACLTVLSTNSALPWRIRKSLTSSVSVNKYRYRGKGPKTNQATKRDHIAHTQEYMQQESSQIFKC
jgi:hypothetical protein